MIRCYNNVLDKKLINDVMDYFKSILDKDVWSSNVGWDQNLSLISSNVLTHRIYNSFLFNEIKKNVEKVIQVNFENEKLTFIPSIYVWSGGSYITWHLDDIHPYNGTIYLNEEWDSDCGGIFLYKDNNTNKIKGIEPNYNSMIVNSSTELEPHNLHCVTCIVPGTVKKRLTIQWRTIPNKKNPLSYQ